MQFRSDLVEERYFGRSNVGDFLPMAVLGATWQRGHPATSPWKLEIRGYTFVGRTELNT